MPETEFDRSLEQLLAYTEADRGSGSRDDDRFVVGVMQRIGRERRKRQMILLVFGVIGALFGAFGAFLLTDSISKLFTEILPGTVMMQAALLIAGIAAFYIWFMGDDLPLEG